MTLQEHRTTRVTTEQKLFRSFGFLLAFFGAAFCILGVATTLDPLARGESFSDLAPRTTDSILLLISVCICFLTLMSAMVVGFQSRRPKDELSTNRDAKLLTPITSKPRIKTTKKHWSGVQRLQPNDVSWGEFLLLLTACLGFTILLVALTVDMVKSGEPFWSIIGMACFSLPFYLLLTIAWHFTISTFMQLRNPILSLGVTKNPVALGEQTAVVWEMVGKTSCVKNLKFELNGKQVSEKKSKGQEERHYIEEVFEVIPFYQTCKPAEIKSGSMMLSIPEFTIHSLKSGFDEIVWTIVVTGEIFRWPNLKVGYTIGIVPPKIPNHLLQQGISQTKTNRPVPPVKPPVKDKAF